MTDVKGFSKVSDSTTVSRQLIVGTHGLERTGKSRFCATAPDPIGVIPLDRNTRWTIEKAARELGKTVLFPDEDFIRQDAAQLKRIASLSADVAVKEAVKYYRQHLERMRNALYELYAHPDIRTVVIDTGTQLWEDVMFANFGRFHRILPRDRGVPNQEMADLLVACPKNLIITHRSADVWKNDKPTDQTKPGGWSHVGYYCNVMIEHGKRTVRKDGGGREVEFTAQIYDCTANPELMPGVEGSLLKGEEVDFAELAVRVFPESDLTEWM